MGVGGRMDAWVVIPLPLTLLHFRLLGEGIHVDPETEVAARLCLLREAVDGEVVAGGSTSSSPADEARRPRMIFAVAAAEAPYCCWCCGGDPAGAMY